MKNKKINVNSVKAQNRKLIIAQMINNDDLTRTEIARNLELSNATVGTIVDEYTNIGLINETKDLTSSVGRRPNLLKINAEHKIVLAINLNTLDFNYALLDIKANIILFDNYIYDEKESYINNLENFLLEMKLKLITEGIYDTLIGIGISVPGSYNNVKDKVNGTNIIELNNISLKALTHKYFNVTVIVENDANLALQAEIQTIKNYYDKSIVFIYIGKGVGGAIAIDGIMHKGRNNFCGEVGQMLIEPDITFETAVSWTRFEKEVKSLYTIPNDVSFEEFVLEKYNQDDIHIHDLLNKIKLTVSQALNNVIWVIDPDTIIIGGRYNIFGEQFFNDIKENTYKHILPVFQENLNIKLSVSREHSIMKGVGLMIINNWINIISINPTS